MTDKPFSSRISDVFDATVKLSGMQRSSEIPVPDDSTLFQLVLERLPLANDVIDRKGKEYKDMTRAELKAVEIADMDAYVTVGRETIYCGGGGFRGGRHMNTSDRPIQEALWIVVGPNKLPPGRGRTLRVEIKAKIPLTLVCAVDFN